MHGTHSPFEILKGDLHPHVHPPGESCCPLVIGKNSAPDPFTLGALVQGWHWVRYDALLSGKYPGRHTNPQDLGALTARPARAGTAFSGTWHASHDPLLKGYRPKSQRGNGSSRHDEQRSNAPRGYVPNGHLDRVGSG